MSDERRSAVHLPCRVCGGDRTERDLGSGLCESCRVLRGEPSREDAKRKASAWESPDGQRAESNCRSGCKADGRPPCLTCMESLA